MELTVEILQNMVAELLKNAPPKQNLIVHAGTAYLLDDVPDPYFIPLDIPKFEITPRMPYLGTYGTIIADPMSMCHLVDASLVPDARPIRLSLRHYLKHYGYRMYTAIKRQRRERACR
jgi:hypothetical protein